MPVTFNEVFGGESAVPQGGSGKIYGVVIAIVVDNKDPEGTYRIKVKFPWLSESDAALTDKADKEDFTSTWARIATFMGGPDRGSFFLPEPADEVLVAFEHGDIRFPYIIGSLWNGKDKTIHDNKGQNGKNNYRTIRSRSGSVLTFVDDAENKKEKIILQTKRDLKKVQTDEPKGCGGVYVVLDHTDGKRKIEIADSDNNEYIRLEIDKKKITIESVDGDIEILAKKGKILLDAKEIQTHSSTTTQMKADSDMKQEAGATMLAKSGSTHTIKGSQVLIN